MILALALVLLVLSGLYIAAFLRGRSLMQAEAAAGQDLARLSSEVSSLEVAVQQEKEELETLRQEKAKQLEIYGIWMRETAELEELLVQ